MATNKTIEELASGWNCRVQRNRKIGKEFYKTAMEENGLYRESSDVYYRLAKLIGEYPKDIARMSEKDPSLTKLSRERKGVGGGMIPILIRALNKLKQKGRI